VVEVDVEVDPLSFETSNFYHARDGKPAQDYPWLKGVKVIELHRETTLLTRNARTDQDGPNHTQIDVFSRETASAPPQVTTSKRHERTKNGKKRKKNQTPKTPIH